MLKETPFSRYLRMRHNKTLKDLADMTGIPYNTIQKYSQGTIKPSPSKIDAICQALLINHEEVVKVLWNYE